LFTGLNYLIKNIYDSYLFANNLAVLITIPFGAAVYFAVLIRLGGLKENDIRRLPMGKHINALCHKVPFLRVGLELN
jgi:hypothetical protein